MTPPDTVYPFAMIEDEWIPTPERCCAVMNKAMSL